MVMNHHREELEEPPDIEREPHGLQRGRDSVGRKRTGDREVKIRGDKD